MPKTALIAGASGLIGKSLLSVLLNAGNYTGIVSVGRKKLNLTHPLLKEYQIDFDDLKTANLPDIEEVFCCLGTTMKKSGSKEAFRKVDYDYVLNLAHLSFDKGAKKFNLVSSMGADPNSIFFYNKVKGQIESELSELNFSALNIFRPSLLLGIRNEKRTAEDLSKFLFGIISPLMVGGLKKYRPIEAASVALAMFRASQMDTTGINIYKSDAIAELADAL